MEPGVDDRHAFAEGCGRDRLICKFKQPPELEQLGADKSEPLGQLQGHFGHTVSRVHSHCVLDLGLRNAMNMPHGSLLQGAEDERHTTISCFERSSILEQPCCSRAPVVVLEGVVLDFECWDM